MCFNLSPEIMLLHFFTTVGVLKHPRAPPPSLGSMDYQNADHETYAQTSNEVTYPAASLDDLPRNVVIGCFPADREQLMKTSTVMHKLPTSLHFLIPLRQLMKCWEYNFHRVRVVISMYFYPSHHTLLAGCWLFKQQSHLCEKLRGLPSFSRPSVSESPILNSTVASSSSHFLYESTRPDSSGLVFELKASSKKSLCLFISGRRSSARETIERVAPGALSKKFLKTEVYSTSYLLLDIQILCLCLASPPGCIPGLLVDDENLTMECCDDYLSFILEVSPTLCSWKLHLGDLIIIFFHD
ncbi:unnamed protein product [Arabidopsis halleri]